MVQRGDGKMKNQVNEPQMVEFRQTLNTYTKQWCVPKKKEGDKWIPIINLKYVITKREGIGYALWRLRALMIKLKCVTHNQLVWDCSKITKTRRGVYIIHYFKCNRYKHSISGVM